MREKYTQVSEDEFCCEKGISYRIGDVIALTPDISFSTSGFSRRDSVRVFKITGFEISDTREGIRGYDPDESCNGEQYEFVYAKLAFGKQSFNSVHLSNIMRLCDYDDQRFVYQIPELQRTELHARIDEWRKLRDELIPNKRRYYILL